MTLPRTVDALKSSTKTTSFRYQYSSVSSQAARLVGEEEDRSPVDENCFFRFKDPVRGAAAGAGVLSEGEGGGGMSADGPPRSEKLSGGRTLNLKDLESRSMKTCSLIWPMRGTPSLTEKPTAPLLYSGRDLRLT